MPLPIKVPPHVFHVQAPALISFSGGRTSALMLRRILDEHNGELPEGVFVVFANTGREFEGTLDLVRDCAEHWSVPVRWVERTPGPHSKDTPRHDRFREVTHATASRSGEPFEQLIREYGYLANPTDRYCTQELKVRVSRDFMRSMGFEHWTNYVGLRADERGRIASAKSSCEKERWDVSCPLAPAGIVKDDVIEFWRGQPFGLRLRGEHEGNCDLCFLKTIDKKLRVLRESPKRGEWWEAMESETEKTATTERAARWRKDQPPVRRLRVLAQKTALQGELFQDPNSVNPDEATGVSCMCTD